MDKIAAAIVFAALTYGIVNGEGPKKDGDWSDGFLALFVLAAWLSALCKALW